MLTAAETELMADIRFRHMRNVAAAFLNETKAIHLERDLVDFLVKIDKQQQEEIRILNLRISELASQARY